ncbi:SWI/SNF chromatin-remodeling complex subunit [Savitreella phatthalungensis]
MSLVAELSPASNHHHQQQPRQQQQRQPQLEQQQEREQQHTMIPQPGEKRRLAQYLARDAQYDQVMRRMETFQQECDKAQRKISSRYVEANAARKSGGTLNAAAVFGVGYSGFGNGWTSAPQNPRILYPNERKRPRRGVADMNLSRADYRRAAQQDVSLVPIRIDLETDRHQLRDTFVWNAHEKVISVDHFAEHLCEDYGVSSLKHEVSRSIREQLAEYHPHKRPPEDDVRVETSRAVIDDDLRILIHIDILVGSSHLQDRFEWDLNGDTSPEDFAQITTDDLGLSADFSTAIAHAIREQCQMYTKSLFLSGYAFDGRPINDYSLRSLVLPPLIHSVRPRTRLDEHAPHVMELTSDQLERVDKEREREGRRDRRRKRTHIPDLKDVPKTARTPFVRENRAATPQEDDAVSVASSDDIEQPSLIVRLRLPVRRTPLAVPQFVQYQYPPPPQGGLKRDAWW